MPKPSKNTQTTNTSAKIPVNLFNPFSALFCELNICAALPIPAMPSPFGECIRTNTITNNADITNIDQTSVSKVFLLFILFINAN